MNDIELKKCPFCGKNEIKINKFHANWGYGFRATCTNCLATGPYASSDQYATDEKMKNFAITAWNARAEED